MTKYRLIQNVDGCFIKTEVTDIIAAAEARGFELTGFNKNHRQRAELQGHPIFKSLCGPMWDGDAVRYEDIRSNNILST